MTDSKPDTKTNTNDMLLLHRMFRREFGRMPGLVRAAAGDTARSRVVGGYVTEMIGLLHVHHHGEDLHLYPLLDERVSFEKELIDRMDKQHLEVSDALDSIEIDLPSWTRTADPVVGERIAKQIEQMTQTLVDHLEEEEQRILPIAATAVSQAEWDKMAEHGLGSLAPKRRLVILGHILAETSPEEFAEFSAVLPPPVRLLYRFVGKRQYRREIATILG